jgi:Protein of unknown function (DUF551)
MSEWISVKERLPEHNQIVLAWCIVLDYEGVIKARFERYDKRRRGSFDSSEFEEYPEILHPGQEITHWMPLPEPPK